VFFNNLTLELGTERPLFLHDKILSARSRPWILSGTLPYLSKRWGSVHFGYTILAFVFLIFLIVFLKDTKDILFNIINTLVALAGAFGGGYGLKSYLERKR
ncbi:MAG TPA: hypothetical protein VL197_04480, partial [Nitrospirota bacterium]|nr:hypothetical protein [Nitrospirota bacterium]